MAQAFYRCGSDVLGEGDDTFTKSGLALSFTPAMVVPTVRMPDSDSAIVTAHLVGNPTSDGFKVEFSSVVGKGYRLDWVAYADTVEFGETTSLAVTYDDLFDAVRRFLGYPVKTVMTEDQSDEVDRYVQDGVRQFYYPPAVNGCDPSHQWSFLRQWAEISLGSGENTVTLPSGFGRLAGDMRFTDGRLYTVKNVPEGIFRQSSQVYSSSAPRIVTVRRIQSYGESGQLFQAVFWPSADKDYVLSFISEGDGGKLNGDTRPYPLGGGRFSNLVKESCLAVAELAANDEQGVHWARFAAELAAQQIQDKVAGGENFGQMGDLVDPVYRTIADVIKPVITYKGIVL